jgi:hypothetical protein
VATLSQLASRLRSEIGDTPRSFVDTYTGDGLTTRFQLSQAPVLGSSLSIKVLVPAVTSTVTAASAASGTITYTSVNNLVVGQTVTITGLSTTAFNLSNATVASRTSTQFTITSAATGAAVTGSTAVASGLSTTFDVSSTTVIEEGIGIMTLATAPANNAVITVPGTAYRYFTDSEVSYYITTAFIEHTRNEADTNGSAISQLNRLPGIEEYPLILLASTMALYTLANDAAFDIDIISPDGVSIPRSERYRQLTEIIQIRKDQYKDLCAMLGVGLYRIEVMTLRRISRMSNRYIPVYRPQEIDDGSIPQRVSLPIPNYGDTAPDVPVISKDLSLYAGDDFMEVIKFSMDITSYTPLSQIRLYPSIPGSRVGPVIVGTFTLTKSASVVGGIVDTLTMTLPGSVLPNVSYYDLQMTSNSGKVKTYLYGKVFTHSEVSNPLGPF